MSTFAGEEILRSSQGNKGRKMFAAIAVNVQSAAYQIARYRSTLQPDRNPLSLRKSLASRASKRKALGSGAEDGGVVEPESNRLPQKILHATYNWTRAKDLQANFTTFAK